MPASPTAALPRVLSTLLLAAAVAGALRPGAAAAPPSIHSGPARAEDLDRGATLRIWHVDRALAALPELAPGQTPNADAIVPTIDLEGEEGFLGVESPIVATLTGWIVIEEAGAYRFRLTSDDGSRLLLDGARVIDNDGRHGARARESERIELRAGRIPFHIDHFDGGGRRMLRLEWAPPGAGFAAIPASRLWTHRDLTRVTSPGAKRLADGLRPGDGLPVAGVHPAWDRTVIRPEGFEPMVGAMAFLPDGRLVVGTFAPIQRDERDLPEIDAKVPDRLFALSGVAGGDRAAIAVEVIAEGLLEPAGLCVVDGALYVSQRREITRLLDRDGDGFLETHERVASGWEAWNYHQFTRGLVHRDGRLYAALTTAMAPPAWEGMESNATANGPLRGTIIEVEIATGEVRAIAGGARTPNGIGLAPRLDGADRPAPLLYADNQGTWMPTSQLSEVIPGRFYGHWNWTRFVPRLAERFPEGGAPSALCDRPRTPASVLLPQNEVVNSPTDMVPIEDGPFAGQLFLAELTTGGIRRVFLERIDGTLQGAVLRFTQGLECGVNRLLRGPDGALYVGGIGGSGDWSWRGTRFGLERLAPNGRLVFEIHSLSARSDGFELRFTKPVDRDWLADPGNYRLSQWTYAPTQRYGGPKVELEALSVRSAEPSLDGGSVRLRIDGLKRGRCVHLRVDPIALDGEPIWSTEAWYTLNAIPPREPHPRATIGGVAIDPGRDGLGVGALPPAGAATLIGQGPPAAMRFAGRETPTANLTQDDLIAAPGHVEVGGGTRDLVSTTSFGDARLHVEWLSPPGGSGQMAGNSGVYLQERYEIQVLGTLPGAPPDRHEAGAIYGIRAPDRNASAGPGEWQAYDIWFRAPRFAEGRKIEDARISLFWNGLLVHDDAAVPGPTGAAAQGGEGAEGAVQVGRLRLQDHASGAEGPVRYRNIWIAPLDAATPGHPTATGDPEAPSPKPTAPAAPWIDLLEGEQTRWLPRGGDAEIRIEQVDGVPTVIGQAKPGTPNTFLVSSTAFDDFELSYEAWIHPLLNGGVQIRSAVIGGLDRREGALRGIQVELDPSPRGYSGGLYDEARRGWLHPLHAAPAARSAFRPGAWNRFHVIARGPVIETWINGVPAASVFDALDASGHLALQVHSVSAETAAQAEAEGSPLEVRYRGLRLRRLAPAGG
ncbi:MAG TPA: DUF1080 domain-containing protein [Phycisphaerales bacterium]|nr:DUF1080 domain-containing protein [Phycisphaerales bacterium]HMP36782.1 DUF1080 domain-containing protein [Phycisphaerales bacterium]